MREIVEDDKGCVDEEYPKKCAGTYCQICNMLGDLEGLPNQLFPDHVLHPVKMGHLAVVEMPCSINANIACNLCPSVI